MKRYTIGVDFGTDSVRTILVNSEDGTIISNAIFYYPRWKNSKYCDPAKKQFRQHPLDYIEGLIDTFNSIKQQVGTEEMMHVQAISIDTTGSTPCAINKEGIPLALQSGFEENPNAMFVLWKDHTAIAEAEEINQKIKSWGEIDYTKYEGGVYSSEWFWAKIIHILRQDENISNHAYSWVEHCDWIPALLTGVDAAHNIKRSKCAAGHKAMWNESWAGLPSEDFLVSLDPHLRGLREKLYNKTYTADQAAGQLSKEWAQKLGLTENVIVGIGAFDAHIGAIGAQIKPYYLTKVIGTSTCDIMITPKDYLNEKLINGICGQVDGSVIPGMIGLEAGQSAFGDIYAWFRDLILGPIPDIISKIDTINADTRELIRIELFNQIIPVLTEQAKRIPITETDELALDWLNGRRTPDANQNLQGAITGLTLNSNTARIFKALVESTAFGAKAIVERFIEQGVRIDGIIAIGGVAKKSEYVMQVLSDVLNKPIVVAKSDQACALGAAIAASVAGGIHENFEIAITKMGNGFEKQYIPNKENAKTYEKIYFNYKKTGQFLENKLS